MTPALLKNPNDPDAPDANPPMQMPPLSPDQSTANMEELAGGGTADLESHAGPHMNPMLHPDEEPSPQGPPPTGKEQFHNTMSDFGHRAEANRAAVIGLDPDAPDYLQKLSALQAQHGAITQEKARYQMLHPWGGPESAHPGILGKIGHVAGKIGEIAGGAVAPGVVQAIPGTESNLAAQEATGAKEEAGAVGEGQKAAQTGLEEAQAGHVQAETGAVPANIEHTQAETENLKNKPAVEPTLLQDYTKAVQDAIAHGQDPSKSPVVQQLSDSITGIQPQKAATEKTPPHITTLGPDGKSHIFERDPATGQYSVDRGIAPPNYAQVAPSLKTVDIINPQGIPTIQTLAGKEIGPSGTGAYAHEEEQAGAVQRAGTALIADLRDPKNREVLGKLSSYAQQAAAGTPIGDPTAARMIAKLRTFAALQPAMHGFRSRSAQEAFEQIIGGLAKDPDATIASIEGIMSTAGAINPNVGSGPPTVGAGGGGRTSFADWKKSQQK